MLHQMRLHAGPFERIKNGQQQIESRINDDKRKLFKVGDQIELTSRETGEKIICEITELIKKDSFDELFETHPPEMFGGKTKEDLMIVYQFYSKEEEKEWGVVGIKLKIVV